MKNNYLRFGIIYCLAALIIFLAGLSFYSNKKIDELNSNMSVIANIPSADMGDPAAEDPESVISNTMNAWESLAYLNEDAGFYSSVVDTGNDEAVLIESGDFYLVRYSGEIETEIIENSSERYEEKSTQLVPGDSRLMLLEESVSLTEEENNALRFPRGNNVSITGARCDDIFVYGGTLTFTYGNNTKTVNIAKPAFVNEDKSVPYEEWIVRLDDINSYSFGGNSANNQKAHEISDAYVDEYLKGKVSEGVDVREGIFTTTCSEIFSFDNCHCIVTYSFVMNPLQLVIRDNLIVFILSFLALVLAETVIIIAVRKLYLNQKRFELRSEKLTKGIAYDLRGPLAVTRDYLNNWEKMDEDKRSEYSEKIISEVDHMSSLVTRLLELSKVQDGSVKLNREDVDLLLLTKNVKKRNDKAISDKKIDLSIECAEDVYPVFADLEMMYIVINNFMTNAVKYCDHSIRIRLSKTAERVEFSITNDGAGIEQKDLEKVWDVLYSSPKGRSESEENSGVGLSVVKDILDAHNARYSCSSSHKGTNFWFSMDVYKEE